MASTNKTTNYELSQFIETDKPAWLTDYNGDMRTIDSTMKAISDVASGASGSISELADRMSTAEGNITTNTNDIDALEARADSLEAQAQSTAGTIAGIQTEQITQNAGIEAATELGYNLARPYDSASTYAVGAYVLFQNTLYKCITAVSTGEAFDPTKWLAIKATDEIAAGGYTLPIASASQLGGVKVGSGLSIDAVSGVLSAGGGAEYIYYNDNADTDKMFNIVENTSSLNVDGTSATLSNISESRALLYGVKIGNIFIGQLFISLKVNALSGLSTNKVTPYTLQFIIAPNSNSGKYTFLHSIDIKTPIANSGIFGPYGILTRISMNNNDWSVDARGVTIEALNGKTTIGAYVPFIAEITS